MRELISLVLIVSCISSYIYSLSSEYKGTESGVLSQTQEQSEQMQPEPTQQPSQEVKSQPNKQSYPIIGVQDIQAVNEEKNRRPNMKGRWSIPDVGIDVACFMSDEQSVVDAKDSAALFEMETAFAIADHSNQGFKKIKKCRIGTKAYFNDGNRNREYICTDAFAGHNAEINITDNNYVSIEDSNSGGIICYTCNGCWQNVWIVFFQPVN